MSARLYVYACMCVWCVLYKSDSPVSCITLNLFALNTHVVITFRKRNAMMRSNASTQNITTKFCSIANQITLKHEEWAGFLGSLPQTRVAYFYANLFKIIFILKIWALIIQNKWNFAWENEPLNEPLNAGSKRLLSSRLSAATRALRLSPTQSLCVATTIIQLYSVKLDYLQNISDIYSVSCHNAPVLFS